MKTDRKTYCLNAGEHPPKCTSKDHHWVTIYKPERNRGGVHREYCDVCGVEVYYDTSD